MTTPSPLALSLPSDRLAVWWRARRGDLLDSSLTIVAFGVLIGLAVLAVMPWSLQTLDARVAGVVPFWVLLLVGIPVTTWTASHSLALSRFGGAVLIAFDAAVLAFLLWAGSGAVLDEACAAATCGLQGDGRAVLGAGSWTVLAWLVGVAISELRRTRRRGRTKLFNVSLAAVAGSALLVAAYLPRLAMGVDQQQLLAEGAIGPLDLLSIVAAAFVYTGLDFVITATSVAWSEGVRVRQVVQDGNAVVAFAAAVSVLCSAVFAALLTLHNAWSLALLTPVVWSLVFAARVGTLATAEHERSKALYGAAEACQSAQRVDDVLGAVVKAARRALHAPVSWSTGWPTSQQEAVRVHGTEQTSWLVASPRTGGLGFDDRDREVLQTLAAMASQSLARVESTERIRRVAETDGLTGLATRTVLIEAADHAFRHSRSGERTSMIFCDVDEFKAINDTYGHRSGDAVLVEIARRLDDAVRPSDVVARVGGDEFAVLLPGADEAVAAQVRERLLALLREAHDVGGSPRRVVVSTGCATWSAALDAVPAAEATDWLFEQADREMYAVKHTGSDGHAARAAMVEGGSPAGA